MKYIFTLIIALMGAGGLFAQSPDAMSFQAVVRDANNGLVQNAPVGMEISILQGSVNGLAVYIERHTTTTNANGLATLEIGQGNPVTGNFASIDWSNGPYFLQTDTDPNGGTVYSITGTSQLLSVPYAKYAETAGSANETDPVFMTSIASGITAADTANWNYDMVEDSDADGTNELQTLTLYGDTLAISSGNALVLPYDSSVWNLNNDTVFYTAGNVGIGTSSPAATLEVQGDLIRTMTYATGNGPFSELDVGQVPGRVVTVVKKRGDTKLRISYTDNLRINNYQPGGRGCRWEMRANGSSMPNQPLIYDYYAYQAHSDTHRSRTVVGYADGLPTGTHQIEIWVGPVPGYPQGDCSTGWINSTWVIEVEEVH